jgi:uncharacterized membrane protein HdeD (DUF308 family)
MTTATQSPTLKYWWFPLLFGILFLLIGIWILRSPEESLSTLTKIIGVIAIVSGTVQLVFTIGNRRGIPGFGFQLAGGLVDLIIGIILVVNPMILLKVITVFVAIWLIINGISLVMRAMQTRGEGREIWKWELIFGSVLILLAILFIWHPLILGMTIAIWTALAFIILGIFRILLTFRLRSQRLRNLKDG